MVRCGRGVSGCSGPPFQARWGTASGSKWATNGASGVLIGVVKERTTKHWADGESLRYQDSSWQAQQISS